MAIAFAGDSLDGHPPTTTAPSSIVLGVAATIAAVLGVVVATVRLNAAVLFDTVCFAAMAAGVALWLGPGPGLIAAGLAGLVLKDHGQPIRTPGNR